MNFLRPFGSNTNLANLAHRFYWTAGVVMVLAMAIGLLEGLGVSLLIPLLSTLTGSSNSNQSGALAFIGRIAEGHDRTERVLIVSSLILLFVAMKSVLQIVANGFASWIDGRVGHAIRTGLAHQLHKVGYRFFLAEDPARLMNVVGTESWKASDAVRILITQIASSGTVAVFCILLMLVSWKLFVLVAIGGLVTRIVQKQSESQLRKLSNVTVTSNQTLADRMLFAVFGARVIRLFHTQEAERERFVDASDAVRQAILRTERLAGTQGPILEAMHGVLFIVVLLFAIFTGTSLPVLAAFLVLMNRLQPQLRTLEHTAAAFASAAGHFNEVEWLLDDRIRPAPGNGDEPYAGSSEDIIFDHVSFDYGARGEPALHDVNVVLKQGRATALIGSSGAGKSTLINLLCRLLEPTSGRILVGSQQLGQIKLSEWLNSVAVAGQDIDLIDGTIAENIAYGTGEIDAPCVKRAAIAAHATFIDGLPDGFQTLVGPRGLSLSGGQRQRIGIARALARNPKLLILDEATNAVDHETERMILETLQSVRSDMTILVVSHRMSTAMFCDDAIVLARGSVARTGPISTAFEYFSAQGEHDLPRIGG